MYDPATLRPQVADNLPLACVAGSTCCGQRVEPCTVDTIDDIARSGAITALLSIENIAFSNVGCTLCAGYVGPNVANLSFELFTNSVIYTYNVGCSNSFSTPPPDVTLTIKCSGPGPNGGILQISGRVQIQTEFSGAWVISFGPTPVTTAQILAPASRVEIPYTSKIGNPVRCNATIGVGAKMVAVFNN